MVASDLRHGGAPPRLYGDLAERYPLLTPVEDYVEEAASYGRLFETHAARSVRTLLELGCGAGHDAFHPKAGLEVTLVALSPARLALSRPSSSACDR